MPPEPLNVGIVSLGCAKNLVDSEVMFGFLRKEGHLLVEDPATADVLIVNTCAFIGPAKVESIEAVLAAAAMKRSGRCRALIVCGCLVQKHASELAPQLPDVDAFIGVDQIAQIGPLVRRLARQAAPEGEPWIRFSTRPHYLYDADTPRAVLTPAHHAYVKIAEGCNHPCSFCIIPQLRGAYRSRTVASVVTEVRRLLEDGVREVNLISQDSTFYGRDLGTGTSLIELIAALDAIPGDHWIRLLYAHPAHLSDAIIDALAGAVHVVPYVDLPLQHIDDALLTAMRRETTRAQIEERIASLRARIPGLALRTTFIVGFPGETEAQFARLLEFVGQVRFERLGVFAYSREEGTRAARLPGQVPERTKARRLDRLMRRQQEISRDALAARVGGALRVLVESRDEATGLWRARSHMDAPEIDGAVLLRDPRDALRPGTFVTARITGSRDYDLLGTV